MRNFTIRALGLAETRTRRLAESKAEIAEKRSAR